MHPSSPAPGAAPRPFLRAVTVMAFAAGLAACASGGENRAVITMPNQDVLPPETFLSQGYCPPISIRAGTESFVSYERGKEGNSNFVIYQGSITQTARECRHAGGGVLNLKIGVAGRVVGGPKVKAGGATLPIRVAVIKQEGGAVLFSQVYKVPVALTPPNFAADYSQVFDQVTVNLTGADRDLVIYVGFDEGPPKPTG